MALTFVVSQENCGISFFVGEFGLAGWCIDPIVMANCRWIGKGVVVPLVSIVGKISGGILLLRGQLVPLEIVRMTVNVFVCRICQTDVQLAYDVD